MKNKVAINKKRSELIKLGVIFKDEDLFTKNVWRSKGYKVNKDEIPVTQIPLYVYAPRYVHNKNGNLIHRKMLFVLSNFYTQAQVTELKKGA